MKELIEYMARSIVDNPDAVVVSEEDGGDHIVFHLKVADDDMGRVIGKQGRVANAMRTLLKVAAIRQGARAVLEIGEGAPLMRHDHDSHDDDSHDDDAHDDDSHDDDAHEDDSDDDDAHDDDSHEDDSDDDDAHDDDSHDDDSDVESRDGDEQDD